MRYISELPNTKKYLSHRHQLRRLIILSNTKLQMCTSSFGGDSIKNRLRLLSRSSWSLLLQWGLSWCSQNCHKCHSRCALMHCRDIESASQRNHFSISTYLSVSYSTASLHQLCTNVNGTHKCKKISFVLRTKCLNQRGALDPCPVNAVNTFIGHETNHLVLAYPSITSTTRYESGYFDRYPGN